MSLVLKQVDILASFMYKGGSKGGKGHVPPKPQVFFTIIILYRRVLFYKFTDITGHG